MRAGNQLPDIISPEKECDRSYIVKQLPFTHPAEMGQQLHSLKVIFVPT